MERNLYLQGKVQSQGTFLGLISNTPGESPQLVKVGDLYANRSLPSSPLHSSKFFTHYRHQTHQSVFLFHLNSPTFFITFSIHLCHAQSVKSENERWYMYFNLVKKMYHGRHQVGHILKWAFSSCHYIALDISILLQQQRNSHPREFSVVCKLLSWH